MKGQAINVNWVIGVGIFFTSVVFVVAFTFDSAVSTGLRGELESQAEDARQSIVSYASTNVLRTPIYVRSNDHSFNVPIRLVYSYDFRTETAVLNFPGAASVDQGKIRTVISPTDLKIYLTQFFTDVSQPSYSNSIETGDWLNNSRIALKPGNQGIKHLNFDGEDRLRLGAEFDSDNFKVIENSVYGSTLDGNVELYNDTAEIVLTPGGTADFNFKNYTRLYWEEDSSQQTLSGTGEFENGQTSGMVIDGLDGESTGVVVKGDLDAKVHKPNADTVSLEFSSQDPVRMHFYSGDLSRGRDRLEFDQSEDVRIGAAEPDTVAILPRLSQIESWREDEVERRFGLGNIGYNITIGTGSKFSAVKRLNSEQQWRTGEFLGTTAGSEELSGDLRIGYQDGESSDSLKGFWRLDGNPSQGNYPDYSGNNLGASPENGVRLAEGVFSTPAALFDGDDSRVVVNSGESYLFNQDSALSLWIRSSDQNSGRNGIVGSQSSGASPDGWAVAENSDGELALWSDSSGWTDTNIDISGGEWHHIAITHVGGTTDTEVYLDGVSQGSFSHSEPSGSHSEIYIGDRDSDAGTAYEGRIDELRIYNETLTAGVADQLYLAGSDGKFEGTYSVNISGAPQKDWGQIRFQTSEYSEDASLDGRFRTFDQSGNLESTRNFNIGSEGRILQLEAENSETGELKINGTTGNPRESWLVNFARLEYERPGEAALEAGSPVPFSETTVLSESLLTMEKDGDYREIDSRVVVWE